MSATSSDTVHILVLHVVECRTTELRDTIAVHAARLELTVRLYYRVVAATDVEEATWRDVIVIAEGLCANIDEFVAVVKSRSSEADDGGTPMRGASVLLRQWNYILPDMPAVRHTWGYAEWVREAERELEEWSAQNSGADRGAPGGSTSSSSTAAAPLPRHLGPAGIKGATYHDWNELVAKRLTKLGLGCSWEDVVLAAQLSTASADRVEAPVQEDGGGAKRKKRAGERSTPRSAARSGAAPPAASASTVSGCMRDLRVSETSGVGASAQNDAPVDVGDA